MGRKLTSQTFHFLNSNKFPHISVTGRNQKTEGLCTDVGVFSSGCQVNSVFLKTSLKTTKKQKQNRHDAQQRQSDG